jgi:hypothetical protein
VGERKAITHRDGRLSFDSPSLIRTARRTRYITALAYELISQFSLISSNCGVVHSIDSPYHSITGV